MSVYTIIYPDKDEFPQMTDQQRHLALQKFEAEKNSAWGRIVALCAATPKDITPDKQAPIDYISDTFDKNWNAYLKCCNNIIRINRGKEYWDDYAHWQKESKAVKPSIEWNYFQYSNDPDGGIEQSEEFIEDCRQKFFALACSTPKETKDEEGYAIHPIDELERVISMEKETLDDAIRELEFSKLLKKYWSTHEIG